jgi:HTH-type transcriptional regulator/antitoxin HipB
VRIRTLYDLAAAARGRRLDRGWSQAEVARRAGVSRKWVSGFETGRAGVELAPVLRLLDALGLALSAGDPPPVDPSDTTSGVDLDAHLATYLSR